MTYTGSYSVVAVLAFSFFLDYIQALLTDDVDLPTGGVGVTPAMSILRQISLLASTSAAIPFRHVYFLWVVKDPLCLLWFADELEEAERNIAKGLLSIQLHVTLNSKRGEGWQLQAPSHRSTVAVPLLTDDDSEAYVLRREGSSCPPFHSGRPNLSKLFLTVTEQFRRPNSTCSVGVICSGPKTLKEDTSRLAVNFSDSRIHFHLHSETFRI